jgi:signal transduction histidine kinase
MTRTLLLHLPLLAVAFSVALGLYVAKRGTPGQTTRLYLYLNFSIAFYALGSWVATVVGPWSAGLPNPQRLWYLASVFGQWGDVLIPIWVMFAASYAGRGEWLKGWRLALVWLPFIAGALIVLTDPLHHGWLGPSPTSNHAKGVLFPWYFASLALMNLLGQFFFFRMVLEAQEIRFRRQAALMGVASAVPLLANLIYYFGPNVLFGHHWKMVDISVLSFIVTDLCFFYILFKLEFLDLLPLALSEVFSAISDPILLVNNRMVILRLNHAAQRLVPQAKPGDGLHERFPDLALKIAERAQGAADPAPLPIQLQLEGRQYLVRMIDVGPAHQRGGMAVMFTDVTDLTRAREEAWAAGQSQTRFLMKMSHQLRNPLQGIIGYNEILAGRLAGEDQVLAARSLEQARRMLVLVNDLIDFSRATREPDSGERKALSLRRLAEDLKASMGDKIQAKGLRFDVLADPSLPSQVLGDLRRIRQVLLNLLENSWRFTERGSVVLHVSLARRDGRLIEIKFTVEDTGRGMSPEEQAAAFETYGRFELTARASEGSGLGLPLSRELVRQLGGKLQLESELGRGTRATFTLTMEEEKGASPASETPAAPNRGGVRVLIAEDQAMNRELILMLVTGWGCRADAAEDGRRAFELFMEREYDIVLLDIQMPEMNGFEVARAIRALPDPARSRVPIIALTGHAYADRGDGDTTLMNDWLIKPVPSLDLQATLWKWADKRRS